MRMTIIVTLLLFALGQFTLAQTPPIKASTTNQTARIQGERERTDERTIADSELTPVAAQSCGSESRLKSLSGDTRSFLRFKNKSTKEITYYWINYEGKRDQKRTLKPGEEYSVWTYLTHPFVLVDAKGECRAVYLPQKEYGLVVISEASK